MSARLPLADIQFISDFAAFCRTKGDERYNAYNSRSCALAQFGHEEVTLCALGAVPEAAYEAAVHGETGCGSGPFSALADRLEALIADSPVVSVRS